MNILSLASAGLRHNLRGNLGVLAGFTIASAVLVGALLVGDSVRGSLRVRAAERVGGVRSVIAAEDRAFRGALASELAEELPGLQVAPALVLPAHASANGGERRANDLVVLGVDQRFFGLAPRPGSELPGPREAALADVVAARLGVEQGDELLLRVEAPSALPRDMILAPTEESTLGLRVTVSAVLSPADFARFGLSAGPLAPGNVFVDRGWFAEELGLGDVANLIVTDAGSAEAHRALAERWKLEDVQLESRATGEGVFVLTSPRVFLDAPVEEAVRSLGLPALGVLTYFVNAIESDRASTPYSMVAALGDLGPPTGWVDGLADGHGLAINDWTSADHEGLNVGGEVDLRWWVPGPDRLLREEQRTLAVGRVVPMEGLAADPDLMPAFPGLEGEEHCRDWEPGVAIDLSMIRDQDEVYWEEHAGTPKGFLPLTLGQDLWSNRFGTLTAVRAPDPGGEFGAALRAALTPGQFGLEVRDLAGAARSGSRTPTDFGGLFIGLSFFLITAALLLAGLLFAFGVEQRAPQVGALLAVGWSKGRVRRLLMLETTGLAVAGALLGVLLGMGYTRAVLALLGSVWAGAVASTPITYHAGPLTLAAGGAAAVLAALLSARLALRWLGRRQPLELLGMTPGLVGYRRPGLLRRQVYRIAGLGALAGAVLLAVGAEGKGAEVAGAFFGAGALLLVAGLAASRLILMGIDRSKLSADSIAKLGIGGAVRRPSRSMITVGLLAAGTFLVVSIGVHRRSEVVDPADPSSGTGGFALVGRSTLPVNHRVETDAGRDAFALSEEDLTGVEVLPLRRRDGDDASCLNLGAPQRPRLLGVDTGRLVDRGAFTFTVGSWELLNSPQIDGAVPAIGDAASIQWSLKRAVGDELTYVDGRGESFRVRIVGAVQDSILQGSLLIDEAHFRERFPDDRGWREFLVDAPAERADEVSRRLTSALGEAGLALEPAATRLQGFRAVQNTYLDIFQVLGALGVLLGSVGVGVVVLRNAHERRSELATLRAVGYGNLALFRLMASEHGLLLVLGLGTGLLAAGAALIPSLTSGGGLGALPSLVLAMLLNGFLWVSLAAAIAVRGVSFGALRNE